MKSDSSPERDRVLDDDLTKDSEVCDNSKKRKRKPYRPGEEQGTENHQITSVCRSSSLPVCLRDRGLHGASAGG